jgi:DNA-binding NarL/FixJ family response regulator
VVITRASLVPAHGNTFVIVSLAADGFSDQEIAERLGSTDRTVSKWRRSSAAALRG